MESETPRKLRKVTEIDAEIIRCINSSSYFAYNHIRIKASNTGSYVPFRLYQYQAQLLNDLRWRVADNTRIIRPTNRLVAILKARQLGCTTVVLAHVIHVAIMRPGTTVLLLSKGLRESKELIGRVRMAILQLPNYLRPNKITIDSRTELEFSNGSRFISFGSVSSQGDSYTCQLAVLDECDLVGDLEVLMGGVMPTLAEDGQLIMLTRADKSQPNSHFKDIWRNAGNGRPRQNDYFTVFIPWQAVPTRNQDWYDKQVRNASSIDYIWEMYPATQEQALAGRQEAKRLPLRWLEQCYQPEEPLPVLGGPNANHVLAGLPGLRIFREPEPNKQYVIGADPAGGKMNPNNDDSSAQVLDKSHQEQVAHLINRIEPGIFGDYLGQLARYYNNAGVLPERNNHGHAVILYLRNHYPDVRILFGPDQEPGYNKTDKTKIQAMDLMAETLRCGGLTIHDAQTFQQLANIETATNKAPVGDHDDAADSMCIALYAADQPVHRVEFDLIDNPLLPQRPGDKVDLMSQINGQARAAHQGGGNVAEGIFFNPIFRTFTASVEPAKPIRNTKRLIVGSFPSQLEAQHAHNVAQQTLGRRPVHPLVTSGEDGQIRTQLAMEIAAKVKTILLAQKQL